MGSSSIRSSVETARDALSDKIAYLTEFLGGEYERQGVYPVYKNTIISALPPMHKNTSHGTIHIQSIPEPPNSAAQISSHENVLDLSIMNGFETITRLGGYILLFSVLAGCIRYYEPFPPFFQYLAQEILDSATQDANSIRLSAITYTDDMMANIGSVLNTTLEDAGVKYKTFIDSLQSCLDVVNHNRQELAPQTAQAAAITGSYHDNDTKDDDDDDLLDDLGEN